MSEFIDREKAIANIKAAYCCGCEHYNGVRCRACQIMDAMDVLEDEPAVVPDVQCWRKTAEEPPTEADANEDGDVLSINNNPCDGFITNWPWNMVAAFPENLPVWMPMPKRPRIPISARVNVRCVYYMKTARRVDLANLIEATTDILVKARVLEDDNSKIVAAHDGSRVELDRENPRVEIEIEEMEDENG